LPLWGFCFQAVHGQNKKALPERHSDRAVFSHQTMREKTEKFCLSSGGFAAVLAHR
jgi:hypothetical protein